MNEGYKVVELTNHYNNHSIYGYSKRDKYYFLDSDTGRQSKVYKIILSNLLMRFDWYLNLQLELFSGRKHLFMQEEVEGWT